jgi:hypothetical protein
MLAAGNIDQKRGQRRQNHQQKNGRWQQKATVLHKKGMIKVHGQGTLLT